MVGYILQDVAGAMGGTASGTRRSLGHNQVTPLPHRPCTLLATCAFPMVTSSFRHRDVDHMALQEPGKWTVCLSILVPGFNQTTYSGFVTVNFRRETTATCYVSTSILVPSVLRPICHPSLRSQSTKNKYFHIVSLIYFQLTRHCRGNYSVPSAIPTKAPVNEDSRIYDYFSTKRLFVSVDCFRNILVTTCS